MPQVPTRSTPATTPKASPKPGGNPSRGVPAKQAPERPILFPEIDVKKFEADNPLTAQMAKDLLGWDEEREDNKFNDPMLTDDNGTNIRCLNNSRNRPFTPGWARALSQDILKRHFAPKGPNGETIIFDKTGICTSGQHRLIGLVLATQIWNGPHREHWLELWPTEPTIQTLVVFGVDGSAETTRTLDNVRPRTLSDVLFTSDEFARYKAKDRKPLCNICDHAVRLLWHRTGADADAFSPKRTHSEALDFISRHPRILKAVKHVYEENKEGIFGTGMKSKIRIGPGYAAGLMYLMGASATDASGANGYWAMDIRGESKIKWANWDKAQEFWVLLASGAPAMKGVRTALGNLENSETGAAGSMAEKTAALCKAWEIFLKSGTVRDNSVKLNYSPADEDGNTQLLDNLNTGGIDMGEASQELDDEDTVSTPAGPERTEPSQKAKDTAEKLKALREQQRQRATPPVPEEVRPTKVEYDKDGKPPAPKLLDTPLHKRPDPVPNGTPSGTPKTSAKPGGSPAAEKLAQASKTKVKPLTRKEVEADNTRKAKEADEAKTAETAAEPATV